MGLILCFFFFQAEDGIRDGTVTGVQTCALPICGMAMGYYSATGKTGVASVTCGPGVTQITTALSTAVRARIPLVVFAGESPIDAKWYNQAIDQAPVVASTGAHYVRAHSAKLM